MISIKNLPRTKHLLDKIMTHKQFMPWNFLKATDEKNFFLLFIHNLLGHTSIYIYTFINLQKNRLFSARFSHLDQPMNCQTPNKIIVLLSTYMRTHPYASYLLQRENGFFSFRIKRIYSPYVPESGRKRSFSSHNFIIHHWLPMSSSSTGTSSPLYNEMESKVAGSRPTGAFVTYQSHHPPLTRHQLGNKAKSTDQWIITSNITEMKCFAFEKNMRSTTYFI